MNRTGRATGWLNRAAALRRWLFSLLLLIGCLGAHADPLRVTTWNLGWADPSSGSDERTQISETILLDEAVSILRNVNTDIVFLQGVPSRDFCDRLAARLQNGNWQVAVCSEFKQPADGVKSVSNLAILVNSPNSILATHVWQTPGDSENSSSGVTARLSIGGRVVLFCNVLGGAKIGAGRMESAPPAIGTEEPEAGQGLLGMLSGLVGGGATQTNVAVISLGLKASNASGGATALLNALSSSGFRDLFQGRPPEDQITRFGREAGTPGAESNFLLVRGADFVGLPRIVHSTVVESFPVTASVELALRAGSTPVGQALSAKRESTHGWLPALLSLAGVLLAALGWLLYSNRPREPETVPANANFSTALSRTAFVNPVSDPQRPPDQVPLAATETRSSEVPFWRQRALEGERRAQQASALAEEQVAPHLARLMKDKLIWRLLAQRSQTIRVQDGSAKVVAELEQRLATIQLQFQSRVHAYESRIRDLEHQISEQGSINRELLEAKIHVVRRSLEQSHAPVPKAAGVYTLRFGDLMARKSTTRPSGSWN